MFHCHILDHNINPDDSQDEMAGLMTYFDVKTKNSDTMPSMNSSMGSMGE
jgi:hypothetical protein